MTDEIKNLDNITLNRFVAFINIMGFTDTVSREEDQEKIRVKLLNLISSIKPESVEKVAVLLKVTYNKELIKTVIFQIPLL